VFHNHRVSVVIPALNEEQSIPKVINDIPRDIVDDLIVVDNGSSDNTAFVAKEYGAKVVREDMRGYGAACLKGISLINKTDIIVILDADYSIYFGQIDRLLTPIIQGEYDFVLGSRILGQRERGALPSQAYWGNKLSVFLIGLLFGYSFTDMGPFRAIRFDSFKKLKMIDKDFGWNVEMQIKAIRYGLRIKEVPVDYRKRIGVSKISGTISGTIKAGAKIMFTIMKYIFVDKNKVLSYERTQKFKEE